MTISAIRVILADDHAVVRRGIHEFLTDGDDIVVLAEAETGRQAYELARQHLSDVLRLTCKCLRGTGVVT